MLAISFQNDIFLHRVTRKMKKLDLAGKNYLFLWLSSDLRMLLHQARAARISCFKGVRLWAMGIREMLLGSIWNRTGLTDLVIQCQINQSLNRIFSHFKEVSISL